MQMGQIYETALTVEGYQSSGWADVYKLVVTADDGQWDAYIDSLTISAAGSVSPSNGSSSSGNSGSSINPNGKIIPVRHRSFSALRTSL